MTESDHRAADVIDAYRRRRNRMMPLLLGGLAVVLLVVGVFLIVVWLTGENPPSLPFLSTKTPTPTVTPTPLPSSATPTITMTPAPTQSPTASGPRTYIVEANDTLYSIAQKFSTTIDLLLAYNPKVTNPNNIPVGSQLIIPEPNAQLPTETPMQKTPVPGTRIDYTVKGGDTLQSIAAKVQQHRRGDRPRQRNQGDGHPVRREGAQGSGGHCHADADLHPQSQHLDAVRHGDEHEWSRRPNGKRDR